MKILSCLPLRALLLLSAIMFTGLSAQAQTAVLQINAGGGAVSPFSADTDYDTGNQYSSTASINTSGVTNAAPAAVYQSVRWNSSFTYTLGGLAANTSYVVRLHFVELTWTAAGQRVFNVAINGSNVLSNFDIFAQVGQNHALVRDFNATSNSSGQIVVAFSQGSADNPSVAGIEVLTQPTVPSAPTSLSATAGNGTVSLSWTASSGATSYNVYRGTSAGGESSTPIATGLTSASYTDASASNGTTYYYKVAAVNSAGTSALSAETSATPTSSGAATAVLQINAGGGAVSPFVADTDYDTGNQFSSTASISTSGVTNAAPAAVYQSVRWNPSFTYTLSGLTAGTSYQVRLHFVELSFTAAGQRVFNVAINGTNVLSNFDIFALVGQNHALEREFNATANSSGQIVVSFSQGSADNPSVAGIEVWTQSSQSSVPSAPTGLAATAGNGSVSLSWTGSSGATSYNVYRGTSAGGESSTPIATGLTSASYTDSAVSNGTTYYYKVAAVNSSGTSALSTESSATPTGSGNNPPPNTAVLQINAGGGAVSPFVADTDYDTGTQFSSTASINTSGVTNAAPAAVYQSVRWNSSFTYTLGGLTSGTSYVVRLHFVELSFTAAGQRQFNVAINGTNVLSNFDIFAAVGENHALVRDFNATANSSGQIVVSFSQGSADNPSIAGIGVWTQPSLPSAPTSLAASAGNGIVSLAWTGSSGATSYDVYRGISAGGENNTPIATGLTSTSYTDTTVSNGTTYYYKVAAVNSAGSSPLSNEASALPQVVAPNAPTSPTATGDFGSVSLTWGASQGATSYSVYRGTSAGGESAMPYATGITGTSYTDSSVTAGTTYYYTIVAVDSAGSSPASTEVSATPLSVTAQGGSFPWTRYRAADSTVASYGGGATLKTSPTFDRMNLATQASGQAYVELSTSGSYVQWTVNQSNQNGVTMRFTLPDAANGLGQNGSVDCYVNGTKVKTINLTSYYAWQYFGGGGDPSDTPVSGDVPAFAFDEVHWKLPTALNPGDVIRIQSTGGPVVGVDFIETETIPAAVAQPAGSVSVADYGAVAYSDNSAAYSEIAQLQGGSTPTTAPGVTDSLSAFNAAVTAALASPSKTLYIPAGTYYLSSMWVIGSTSSPISKLNIVGAGIWYTNIQFTNPNVGGGGCSIRLAATGTMNFSHVYLNSMLRSRYNENAIYKCFMDNFGVNSDFHDLWEDHFECGFWVADYAYNPCQVASNLTIQNCRIRDNLADGVNFCNGTNNSTVTNCNIRNGGDDGLAVWPNNYNSAPMAVDDTFDHNTIEFEWRSSGIALYGGSGHQVTNNLVEDTFMSAGFRSNTTFPGYHFDNNTGITVSNNSFIDCGTSYDSWAGELGAVDMEASNTSIKNFTFTNDQVIDAQRDGYSFGFSGGFSGILLKDCSVNGTGLDGITTSKYTQAHLGAGICTYGAGAATFQNMTWANCAGGNVFNQGGFVLTFQ